MEIMLLGALSTLLAGLILIDIKNEVLFRDNRELDDGDSGEL